MAAIASGLCPADTDWTRIGTVVQPNPANRELYDSMYPEYCGLYPATKPFVHKLAKLQEGNAD